MYRKVSKKSPPPPSKGPAADLCIKIRALPWAGMGQAVGLEEVGDAVGDAVGDLLEKRLVFGFEIGIAEALELELEAEATEPGGCVDGAAGEAVTVPMTLGAPLPRLPL